MFEALILETLMLEALVWEALLDSKLLWHWHPKFLCEQRV
jgi:hypothetical protein